MTPAQRATALIYDLADEVERISLSASHRVSRHMVFVLDRDDSTARELLTEYAPPHIRLATGGSDDVHVLALTVADGLRLLRAPNHQPTRFRRIADQIEAAPRSSPIGFCITAGGFQPFELRLPGALN